MKCSHLWINANVLTGDPQQLFCENAAIAVADDKILWFGTMQSLPAEFQHAEKVYDAAGRWITPGLIDCHTHVVYAGNRANEFAMRLQGASYEEIAKAGGGILATVKATRAASEDALYRQSIARVKTMIANGVTTLEIKSGYGLDLATELKMLRVARRIEAELRIHVVKTFLGAHALPPEFAHRMDDYVDYVCDDMLPAVAKEKLADCVDVFCEKIAFDVAHTEKIFKAAQQYGLKIKCHAEQLSNMGAARLASNYQAVSVDHLEYLDAHDIKLLAQTGTTAVLLPGAFYTLREHKTPPITTLRNMQVPMALASDCNPGTSPITSLLAILNMACTLFRLTPDEAWLGVTHYAAKALGIENSRGRIRVGYSADLAVWDITHPYDLVYYLGQIPLHQLMCKGSFLKQ